MLAQASPKGEEAEFEKERSPKQDAEEMKATEVSMTEIDLNDS